MESKNTKTKRTAKTAKPKTPVARSKSVNTRALAPTNIPESSSDEDISRLAYALWEERGRPIGSPDEDWFQAKAQLNNLPKEAPRQSA